MTFFQPGQRAYCQNVGTSTTSNLVIFQRNPTPDDTLYPIGQFWQNQTGKSLWILNSQTSVDALLQSQWLEVSVESLIASLTGSNTPLDPVFPSSAAANPPNNIELTNLDGSMTITSDPTNHQIIFTANPGASLLPWNEASSSFLALVDNGYFTTGVTTVTLPSAPTIGQVVAVAVMDASNRTTVRANTGQSIRIGNLTSSVAGTAINTAQGDSIYLVYRAVGSTWVSTSTEGNWSLA